jgi:hypothetical protein
MATGATATARFVIWRMVVTKLGMKVRNRALTPTATA